MPSGDATAEFFDSLARCEHEPRLAKAKGTIRVELADGDGVERWLVAVDRGRVAVSRRKTGAAQLTLRTSRELFDRLARGEANALTGILRGEIEIEGSWDLGVLFQRLFPDPPRR